MWCQAVLLSCQVVCNGNPPCGASAVLGDSLGADYEFSMFCIYECDGLVICLH